ncbi:MAG: cobalamin biosynthesis protein CobU, partial [Firmicutes bacterium]|nr:cobalamin biosynthesis protein CobU [Bacillota bacterium]
MILIFGGAYQGKLDYAIEQYNIKEREIYTCEMDSMRLDFDKKVINHAERFAYACVKEGFNPKDILEEYVEKLRDKVIIFDDISQGIVSIDPVER